MAKAGAKRPIGRTRADSMKDRIVQATIDTLRREGFTGTSARAIAATGGFNQAQVFYYFGTVNELLVEALDRISEERMARYRATVDGATTVSELVDVTAQVYREDLESGHTTVL